EFRSGGAGHSRGSLAELQLPRCARLIRRRPRAGEPLAGLVGEELLVPPHAGAGPGPGGPSAALVGEELLLPPQAAAVAGQPAIAPHHAMAGHEDRDRIVAPPPRHRARARRPAPPRPASAPRGWFV